MNNIANKITKKVVQFPKTTLLLTIIITVFFFSRLSDLKMETNIESMLPKEMDAYINKNKLEEIFGVKDMIVIGIVNEGPDGIFNLKSLSLVKEITDRLKLIEGINSRTKDDLVSLSTLDNILGTEEGMDVSPFMEEFLKTNEEVRKLKKSIYGNDMFVGSIVSKDGTATIILAEAEDGTPLGELYFKVKGAIDEILKARKTNDKVYIAGRPVIEGVFGLYMPQDMQSMLPLILLLLIVVLFLTFRSLRGIFLPLLVVIISTLWTMSTMAILGIHMYTITTMMPVILVAIGVADGIHILSKYYDEFLENPDEDRKTVVLNTMHEMNAPVIMTSITSAAGFLANLSSQMLPIRFFGIFTAVGIIYAMIFSLTFIPAALVLMKLHAPRGVVKRMKAGNELNKATLSGRFLHFFGNYIFHRHRIITAVTAVVIFVSIYGISTIYVDASLLSEFRKDSPIRQADAVLNKKFSGTTSLNVVIETDETDSMKSPDMLRKIDLLQSYLEEFPEVGDTLSVSEFIKRMNRVMNEDRREMEVIPDSRELVAQYLLLYSFSGDPEDFDDVVDYEYKQANVRANIHTDHSRPVVRIIERLKIFIQKNFPSEKTKVYLAGTAYTMHAFVDIIIKGQILSIIIAIIAIFLLTSFEFHSFFAGLLNIIPVSLSTLIIYAVMGLIGFPLEVGTALTSGIALGVGVDYSIHFINKYRLEARKHQELLTITLNTMVTAGKAIFFNALVVTIGFLVLLKANLYPQVKLGIMVASVMVLCFYITVTLLPVLINSFKPKFIFPKGGSYEA
ncbi:MAG: hypothetical protein CMD96_03530 [Gammaproteobacteria bacterium]|nr:hypothetical protein [Gammaproteobacteria bacterium]HJP19087.1 MMPL family transporter [Nitrospinota bacterium]|tara:strand:- start:232 stop:2601 length:2370 start_codon:yes stop_codon:yes gene_type:complete